VVSLLRHFLSEDCLGVVMSIRVVLLIALVIFLTLIFSIVSAQAQVDLADLITEALKNPRVLVVVVIQFLMGLGLGYFSFKVWKYLLALIAIIILGNVLAIWSLGSSPESFLGQLYESFKQFLPNIISFIQLLGIMTIGPVTIGFIVGIILAIIKK
jgi:magnesium-transporting ATPase (P-type)